MVILILGMLAVIMSVLTGVALLDDAEVPASVEVTVQPDSG
jgi:hypothetical protein